MRGVEVAARHDYCNPRLARGHARAGSGDVDRAGARTRNVHGRDGRARDLTGRIPLAMVGRKRQTSHGRRPEAAVAQELRGRPERPALRCRRAEGHAGSEALRQKETLARRLPALVSFLFGLVHVLGFAGALKSVGLPQSHLPLALLCFNVGVEIGQLLMVGVAFAVVHLPISQRYLGRARRPALYVVGAVAAYWSWLRVAAIVL